MNCTFEEGLARLARRDPIVISGSHVTTYKTQALEFIGAVLVRADGAAGAEVYLAILYTDR